MLRSNARGAEGGSVGGFLFHLVFWRLSGGFALRRDLLLLSKFLLSLGLLGAIALEALLSVVRPPGHGRSSELE